MQTLLAGERFDAVIHFAALQVLSEPLSDPLSYYDHNVHGLRVLLQAMKPSNGHGRAVEVQRSAARMRRATLLSLQ